MHDSPEGVKSLKVLIRLTLLIQLTACTAHYTVNAPIESIEAVQRFSLEDKPDSRSDELLLILTFSGGGTRAAAFAFGVLQTLADTQIVVDGQKRRLLDEVDVISSVSGGSFTAAYYGLFKDRIFEDFETKFLKYNVQSELTRRVFSPFSWPKLASLHYDRSDIAAEYYDELLFEKKTFQDFITSKGPLIAINATNVHWDLSSPLLGKSLGLSAPTFHRTPYPAPLQLPRRFQGPFPASFSKTMPGPAITGCRNGPSKPWMSGR